MIIGDISKFGIQINNSLGILTKLKFYINGCSVGTFNDETYISTFINNFIYRLDTLYNLETAIPNGNDDYAFNYIHNLADRFKKYRLSIGDSFDDYYIYMYVYNDCERITWKIRNHPTFDYYDHEKNKIFDFPIDKDEIKKCLYELQNTYKINI